MQRPPAFVIGALPEPLDRLVYADFTTGPVCCYRLREACVTYDGVVLHGGQALASPYLNQPDYHVLRLVQDRLGGAISLPVRRVAGTAVMLSGPGYTVYGHWLVDMLPRLWVLHQCGFDLDTLRYIVPSSVPAFVVPLLQTFGIGPEQLMFYDETAEIIQVDTLLLPTNLRRTYRLHAGLGLARDYLLGRARAIGPFPCPATAMPRLFVSRRDVDASRSLTNRARIEEIAIDHGFVAVQPELMTMAEQIGLFQQARQVIGEYGSGLHNTLFAEPGTAICAIRGTSIHPGFVQSSISDICRHHTGYLLVGTPIDAVHQTFEVPEASFLLSIKCLTMLADKPPA